MLHYKFKLGRHKKQLENFINDQANNLIDKTRFSAQGIIQSSLSEYIMLAVKTTNVWDDFLHHGELWRGLGGGDLTSKLENIILHWTSSIDVEETMVNGLETLRFTAVKSDYSDVLALPDSVQLDVPWLKWLLLKGTETLVKEHSLFDDGTTNTANSSWNIPGEYAGTARDNFLTRALDKYIEEAIREINTLIRHIRI